MRTKGLYERHAVQIRKIRRIYMSFGHEDLKRGHSHKDTWITGLTDRIAAWPTAIANTLIRTI